MNFITKNGDDYVVDWLVRHEHRYYLPDPSLTSLKKDAPNVWFVPYSIRLPGVEKEDEYDDGGDDEQQQ